MTKLLVSICLCLAVTICHAQYDISWEINKSCSAVSVNGEGLIGSANITSVMPHKEINLIIETKINKIDSFLIKIKDNKGQEKFHNLERVSIKSKEDEKDVAVEIEIKAQGDPEIKMVIGDMTGQQLVYPYLINLYFDEGKSCELTLGKQELLGEVEDNISGYKVGVLKNIITPGIKNTTMDDKYCDRMEGCNAIIVIDASTFYSAKSRIYRKNCCGKCKKNKCVHKGLWVGDYVKIYLDNFNPYRHTATVADRQIDAEFEIAQAILSQKSEEPSKDGVKAAANSANPIEKLRKYAEAVIQMRIFIDHVKSNTQPDSKILEENKLIIMSNLINEGFSGSDIEALFQNLDAAQKVSIKATYDIAKNFSVVRAELMLLSYIVEATILPIKIRSFDKFEFTVSLKDKTNNEIVSTRVYEYLIKGGIKADQSFGVVFHGIRDQEYGLRSFLGKDTVLAKNSFGEIIKKVGTNIDSISSVADVSKREIIESESPSKIAFGASTLTHLYYRTCIGNRVRIGIGPEVGLSADIYPETAIRYLVGGGILFYDGRHRISIDAGCAFGKFKVIGNGQKFGTILSGADAQPSLIEQTGRSLYLGISYNTPLIRNDTQKK